MFEYSLKGTYFKRCNIFLDGHTCDVMREGVLFSHNCLLAEVAFDYRHVIEMAVQ